MGNPAIKALVVEGSAMRSVFSSGLLDGFINAQFNPFDFYIGVSAGAYNLVSYLTGTQRISINVFEQIAMRKEFINLRRFICGGHLIDLDWLEKAAFNKSHINLHSIFRQKNPLYVGMTDVTTGKPLYIQTTPENIKNVIKASSALPLFYRQYPIINGQPMTDGGVSEGIPIAEAIRMGATHIMVIRARHKHYIKKDTIGHKYMRWKLRDKTSLLKTLANRVNIHKDSIEIIRNPPQGIKILEVCPPESFTLGRFSRNRHRLKQGYQLGYEASSGALNQWFNNLNCVE